MEKNHGITQVLGDRSIYVLCPVSFHLALFQDCALVLRQCCLLMWAQEWGSLQHIEMKSISVRKHFKSLHSKKLESLKDMDEFLSTDNLPKSNQDYTTETDPHQQ